MQIHIFILPNNKNIILAANQAQTLTEDKDIIVVPSKTVPQGITAMINYMPEADAQTNMEAMIEENWKCEDRTGYLCSS